MALEATHIRFALDVQKKYGPVDIPKYMAGAIYPDSRYVTGIDRNLTHLEEDDREKLLQSDFGKGWHAHLVCDDVQYAVTKELFPDIFQLKMGNGNVGWVKHTALKVLQDMDDVQRFDIGAFLPLLSYVENPNGEDTVKLRAYNEIFVKMYGKPFAMTIRHAHEMWVQFGIGEKLADEISRQAEAYAKDPQVMHLVMKIYPEVIARTLSEKVQRV